jgi:hypothetical protein
MKRTIILSGIILLLAVTAMSYYFKRKNKPIDLVYENRITVTGNARNISGHAAVVAPSRAVYFVEGLEQWEQNWLNQEVKVTGDLLYENRIGGGKERNNSRDDSTQVIKAAVVLLLQEDPEASGGENENH